MSRKSWFIMAVLVAFLYGHKAWDPMTTTYNFLPVFPLTLPAGNQQWRLQLVIIWLCNNHCNCVLVAKSPKSQTCDYRDTATAGTSRTTCKSHLFSIVVTSVAEQVLVKWGLPVHEDRSYGIRIRTKIQDTWYINSSEQLSRVQVDGDLPWKFQSQ